MSAGDRRGPMPSGFFDVEVARQHAIQRRLALGRQVADVPEAVEQGVETVPYLIARRDLVYAAVRDTLQALMPTCSPDQLFGDERGSQAAAWMRQAGMYVMVARFGAALGETGWHFGRDRTTVRHALQIVEAAIGANATTAAFIDLIEKQARGLLDELMRVEAETGYLPAVRGTLHG